MSSGRDEDEAMVLSWKRVDCPLWGRGETLHKVEEFRYLGIFFTSDGEMELEINRHTAASVVMWTMKWSVVVKRDLSQSTSNSRMLPIHVCRVKECLAHRLFQV